MKFKLLLALMILTLVGIGSCTEQDYYIPESEAQIDYISPGTKSCTQCIDCGYMSECVEKPTVFLCPKCQGEMGIYICPFGK